MLKTFDPNNEATWSSEITRFLEINQQRLSDWVGPNRWAKNRLKKPGEVELDSDSGSPSFDQLDSNFEAMIRSHTLTHGYHCSRLTAAEIQSILDDGLRLPNLDFLKDRIATLKRLGIINKTIEKRLLDNNDASVANRANRIWFCFYPPILSGQCDIEWFFRYWGGEALYGRHQSDDAVSTVLMGIGTPCLIEADVPISNLGGCGNLLSILVGRYFVNRGYETRESLSFSHFSLAPVAVANINRIIKFRDAEFAELTGCNLWRPLLS